MCCIALPRESLRVLGRACVRECSGWPVLYSERFPLISQGRRVHTAGTPTGGPSEVVYHNVLFIHYGVADKGDLSLDIFAYSWSPSLNMSRRCLVGVAPGVASSVACHVAERVE